MKGRFLKSKDHARLYARAKRLLEHELSKPSDKWDEAMIRECEETMLCCAEMQKKLEGEREAKRAVPSLRARRALIIVLAVLAILLVSSVVAQAAGFRIWSALLHWDAGYLSVEYPKPTDAVPDYVPDHGDQPVYDEEAEPVRFDSAVELRAYLDEMAARNGEPKEGESQLTPELDGPSASKKMILCPGSEYDGQFDHAQYIGDDYVKVIHFNYLFGGAPLIIDVTYAESADDEEHFQILLQFRDNFDSVFDKEVCGTTCAFAEGDSESACYFRSGKGFYYLSGKVGLDTMEAVVASMLGGE